MKCSKPSGLDPHQHQWYKDIPDGAKQEIADAVFKLIDGIGDTPKDFGSIELVHHVEISEGNVIDCTRFGN